nr:MAG TPA: hypothetical protein [Caudoviricetes sp.]
MQQLKHQSAHFFQLLQLLPYRLLVFSRSLIQFHLEAFYHLLLIYQHLRSNLF